MGCRNCLSSAVPVADVPIRWLPAGTRPLSRLLFPVLSALILVRAIRSLLRIPHTPEVWAQLSLPNGSGIPLTHWENILGRSKSADVLLNYPSISRQHAALCRGEDGAVDALRSGLQGRHRRQRDAL